MEGGDTWEANARVLRTLTYQQNTPICSEEVAARSAHPGIQSEKVHKAMQAAVVGPYRVSFRAPRPYREGDSDGQIVANHNLLRVHLEGEEVHGSLKKR